MFLDLVIPYIQPHLLHIVHSFLYQIAEYQPFLLSTLLKYSSFHVMFRLAASLLPLCGQNKARRLSPPTYVVVPDAHMNRTLSLA